jgi:hypothetical protein
LGREPEGVRGEASGVVTNDTKTTTTIQSISISQAEGEVGKLVNGAVSTVDAANMLLRRIAKDGPDLGYYKTDVVVAWSDDQAIRTRFDVMIDGTENNDTDVTRHMHEWAKFIKRTARWGHSAEAQKIADEIIDGSRAVS